jgi:predicted dehydrogenase
MSGSNPSASRLAASRREFLKRSTVLAAGAALASPLSLSRSAHAAGSDQIRIVLVGAGGRGTGAAVNALKNASHKNVKLVAVADAFRDRLESSLKAIQKQCPDQVDVPEDRRFDGLDGYQKALHCDADLVLLCTPPGFRPMQFEAAVKAGRQVFLEKPVAVDAPGYRRVLAANEEAKKKGLTVAVGHHLRHSPNHREIVQQIHDGALGDLKLLRGYFNSSGIWNRPRNEGQTEMQYQVQNWYHFLWLCGDHIVEQHVHDIDVCNWIAQGHPVEANGMGGRAVRFAPGIGEIFDHHYVEFTYANGVKFYSQCRHIPGCWNSFSQHAVGTKGSADIDGSGSATMNVAGKEERRWKHQPDGHQLEMDDLFAALLAKQTYNEVDWAADSSMTAILGRMATYSGQQVRWDNAVQSAITSLPDQLTWDAPTKTKPGPDGIYACPMPGVTKAC